MLYSTFLDYKQLFEKSFVMRRFIEIGHFHRSTVNVLPELLAQFCGNFVKKKKTNRESNPTQWKVLDAPGEIIRK